MNRTLLFLLLLPQLLFAESFVREYTYNAGESDSKVSARKAAMRQIQVLVIEEVGVQIRSRFKKEETLENERYAKAINSQYESFAQAITKTKIIDEKWDGERFYLKAEVIVDPDDLGKVFETIVPTKNDKDGAPTGKCEAAAKQAAGMLTDLTTQVKIDQLVHFAAAHPIDTDCNQWQLDIVRTFNKHRISTPDYRAFLLKSIRNFKQVGPKDKRGVTILSYLGNIQPFTYDEIDSVSKLLITSHTSWLGDYFYLVLSRSDRETGEEYISRILGAMDSKKLGIPVSMDPSQVSSYLTDTLDGMDNDLFEYYYELGFDLIAQYYKDARHLSILSNRYMAHRSEKSFDNLITFIKERTPTCDIAREYLRALNDLKTKAGGAYSRGYLKKEPEATTPYFADLPRFFNETAAARRAFAGVSCREDFSERIRLGFQPYLILNHVNIPDKFTPQQCAREMFESRDKHHADRYGTYLVYYGEEAKKAKPEIIQGLNSRKFAKELYENGMIKNLLAVMENMKIYDDVFVDYLVNLAVSPNTKGEHLDRAKALLFSYGEQGIDRLLHNYPQEHYYKSGDLIRIFTQLPIDKEVIIERLKKLPKVDSMHDRIIKETLKKLSV